MSCIVTPLDHYSVSRSLHPSQLTPIIRSIVADVIFHKRQRLLSAFVGSLERRDDVLIHRFFGAFVCDCEIKANVHECGSYPSNLQFMRISFLHVGAVSILHHSFFNTRARNQRLAYDQTRHESEKASTNVKRSREKLTHETCCRTCAHQL